MAIGGYKFRGYHYPARTATAGSDAEKAIFLDWFKCRLAAFKASCEASGALWRILPSLSDAGEYHSDAWDNECIHELDDTGCNFGTFFQYGNEEKYMAMVSLNSTPASNAGLWKMYNNSSSYATDSGCDFISLDSENPITPDNVFSYPAGRLPLRSVDGTLSSLGASRTVNSQFYGICYGFSTKDSDIEAFSYYGTLANANITATSIWFCAYSLDAFQSLASPSDTYKAASFGYKLTIVLNASYLYTEDWFPTAINFLKNDGSQNFGLSNQTATGAAWVPHDLTARYSSTMAVVPFLAPSVISIDSSISTEKLYTKGTFKVDLAAVNSDVYQRQSVSTRLGWTYGGDNYLCVFMATASSADVYQCAFYIGWDPSNPSILASTSWPDWPDAMPEAQTAPVDPVILQ